MQNTTEALFPPVKDTKMDIKDLEALLTEGCNKMDELRGENKRLRQEVSDLRKELTQMQWKYEMPTKAGAF